MDMIHPPLTGCPSLDCTSKDPLVVVEDIFWACRACGLRFAWDGHGWFVANWQPLHHNLRTGVTTPGRVT